MAVRAYVVFALAVMLGTAYWIADQFGWTSAAKARVSNAAAGGTFHALRLPRTYAVDLDSGKLVREGADLHWGMETRDRPYLASFQGALIALSGDVRWEKVDVKHLAGLNYTAARYPAAYEDSPVRRGTVVAVRTSDGNLAKFRIVTVWKGFDVDVEWVLYPAPADLGEANPWVAWTLKRDEALAAYRAGRYSDAIAVCRGAIAAAARADADVLFAAAQIRCGEMLALHRHDPGVVERWLLRGTGVAEGLGHGAIIAALGSGERFLLERGLRMLGVLRRDQGRYQEAAEYFNAAADAVRALPPPATREDELRMKSNLSDRDQALARSNPGATRGPR